MKANETIFNGKTDIIPMADVQHIEKIPVRNYESTYGLPHCSKFVGADYTQLQGIYVITNKTKFNHTDYCWDNAIYLSNTNGEAESFISAWCRYRAEIDGMIEED